MLTNYCKAAWRNIARQKTFSFINITGLALSLTVVWLIALFVTDELSYDQYHTNANRIYRLVSHGQWGANQFDITGTSALAAGALKSDFPEVEDAIRIDAEGGGVIEYNDKNLKEDAIIYTDPAFFNIFTYQFLAGNTTALQKPNTIVLTRSLATKLFADPQTALDKTIYIDKEPNKVTGIVEDVPANSHFGFHAVRALPHSYTGDWNTLNTYTYILLKKNAAIDRLQAGMPAFVTRYLTANTKATHFKLELQPLTSIHLHSHLGYELGDNRDIKYIYVLSVVGLLILVIAFINYINITTARASVRLREVAVRKIIGSGRNNLIALFLSESILTIFIAACISMVLVTLVMPLFNTLSGKEFAVWELGIARTLLAITAFSLTIGFIGGLYPAVFLSGFKTIPALKNQMGDVKGQTLFRKSLVMFQFAVTVVMITASLVIYLQLNYVSNTDLGFDKKQVLSFHLDARSVREKVPALRNALLQNTNVQAVASAGNPIGNNNIGMMNYSVEKNGVLDEHSELAYGLTIDADFIPTMQIKLLEGRNFSANIASDSNDVIVNEAFIKKQGWASGMGKRIARGQDVTGKTRFANIVGVVKNYHIYSLQHAIAPMIMMLPEQARDRDNIYIRLDEKHLATSLAFIEKVFRQFDASAPFNYQFLDQNFANQYKAEEKQGHILLAFTILTICIAALGLFGLITFTVGQRVKEIGIRKVLGANTGSIVSLVTASLVKVVIIAMVVAVPFSWLAMNKWLEDFAYRIHLAWWIFLVAGIISLLVAAITLGFQAIKAAIANPIKSLRTE
jgi:putative ABC transport system permease protein